MKSSAVSMKVASSSTEGSQQSALHLRGLTELSFSLGGLSPIITHNPAGMLLTGPGTTTKSKIPSPEEEAEQGTYRTAEGYLGFPAIGVRNAVITAAGMHRLKNRSLRGFITHIQVEGDTPDLCILRRPDGEPISEYVIDLRRVVIKGHGAVIRARPRVDPPWTFNVSFYIDAAILPQQPEELFRMLLDDAGSRIGVMDYRPEKGGWFGRFAVIE